jgi:hypothetical protein
MGLIALKADDLAHRSEERGRSVHFTRFLQVREAAFTLVVNNRDGSGKYQHIY